jgi:riboflavin transporter FmnP
MSFFDVSFVAEVIWRFYILYKQEDSKMIFNNIVEFLKANDLYVRLLSGGLFLIILVLLILWAVRMDKENAKLSNSQKIKKMTVVSVLSAISIVLYYFPKISLSMILPFIPGFLELHLSNVPILIGGFLFGPIQGAIITIIRFIGKLPSSSTFGIGELSDLLIGMSTVLVTSIMYKRSRSKNTAKKALISNVFVWLGVALISNWLFILPFYINLFSFETVFGMLSVIPGITVDNYMLYYLLFAIVPFNLILASIISLFTYLTYKRVANIYYHL